MKQRRREEEKKRRREEQTKESVLTIIESAYIVFETMILSLETITLRFIQFYDLGIII
jgi:hypothetical protein